MAYEFHWPIQHLCTEPTISGPDAYKYYKVNVILYKCLDNTYIRALGKVFNFISIMPTSSPNPMFDHLLESSHRDDSDKWSNIGFGEEITQVESIESHFMNLIWSYDIYINV